MAQGDHLAADSLSEQTGKTVHDFGADVFAVALCSDTYVAAAGFINFSQFTEVTGGGYAAVNPVVTWNRSGSKSTLQAADAVWAQDASGPQDIRTAVLYNVTRAGSDDVISIVDLTTDGTTPVDLQAGGLQVNFSSAPTVEVDRQ